MNHHDHDGGGGGGEFFYALLIPLVIAGRRFRMEQARQQGVQPSWDDRHPFLTGIGTYIGILFTITVVMNTLFYLFP